MKTKISRIVFALALVAAFAGAFVIQTHNAPKAYAYVECSSLVWATVLGPGSNSSNDGKIRITGYLQKAEDAHDFNYCGSVRTYYTFSMPTNWCDTFYPSVEDKSGVLHAKSTDYVCANGGNGYSFDYGPSSSGCAAYYISDYLYGFHVAQGFWCP